MATGHCTYISGIVRQVVPEAKVLSIRIMHSDDAVNEGDLIEALKQVALRVARAQDPATRGPALMVDVVSLSLGYFCESPPDFQYTSGLKIVIDALLDQGVMVVAAAGNYAVRRRYYPAAFADAPRPPGTVPVLSVGALNPNGTRRAVQRRRPLGHGVGVGRGGGKHVPRRPQRLADAPVEEPDGGAARARRARWRDPRRRTRSRSILMTSAAGSLPGAAPRSPRRRWPRGSCGRCLTARRGDPALTLGDPAPAAAVSRALHALRRRGWRER